jgi:hypothetical protein
MFGNNHGSIIVGAHCCKAGNRGLFQLTVTWKQLISEVVLITIVALYTTVAFVIPFQ